MSSAAGPSECSASKRNSRSARHERRKHSIRHRENNAGHEDPGIIEDSREPLAHSPIRALHAVADQVVPQSTRVAASPSHPTPDRTRMEASREGGIGGCGLSRRVTCWSLVIECWSLRSPLLVDHDRLNAFLQRRFPCGRRDACRAAARHRACRQHGCGETHRSLPCCARLRLYTALGDAAPAPALPGSVLWPCVR
jgi:hypothetical protein